MTGPKYEGRGARVRIYYCGRWWVAYVIRVTGTEARVWVYTKKRGWKKLRASPKRRGVCLVGEWLHRALADRGLGELRSVVADLRAGRRIRLAEGDFEAQALANALDVQAGDLLVDRGDVGPPEVDIV